MVCVPFERFIGAPDCLRGPKQWLNMLAYGLKIILEGTLRKTTRFTVKSICSHDIWVKLSNEPCPAYIVAAQTDEEYKNLHLFPYLLFFDCHSNAALLTHFMAHSSQPFPVMENNYGYSTAFKQQVHG